MFCYQCQETANNQGCKKAGVCGKNPHLANQLDELIFEVIELSVINNHLRQTNRDDLQASRLITDALFTSITNANFDSEAVSTKIHQIRDKKHELKNIAHHNSIPIHELKLNFLPPILGQASIQAETDQDIRSLKQAIIYGIKGAAAYAEHARRLGYEDATIYKTIEDTLSQIHKKEISVEKLHSYLLGVGELGLKTMHLLDKANTITFGHPEHTTIKSNIGERPGILVSGHDLQDLKELLDQTADKNIDITHTEKCYQPTPTHTSKNTHTSKETMATHGGNKPKNLKNSTGQYSSQATA